MPTQSYSTDIWEYLTDMPYMPTRADRDALAANPALEKRLRLWDFFFRINPQDVGKPQKQEINALEQKRQALKKSMEQEINRLTTQEQQGRQMTEQALTGEIARLRSRIETFASNNKTYSRLAIGGGIVAGLGAIGLALPLILGALANSNPDVATSLCCVGGTSGFLGGFMLLIGIVVLAVGLGGKAVSNRTPLAEMQKELSQKSTQLENLRNNPPQAAAQQAQAVQAAFEQENRAIQQTIQELHAQIAGLVAQIPKPVDIRQVLEWLQQDIRNLTETAAVKSGLSERLVQLDETPNPLCFLGPAELQESSRIHPSFFKNPDLNKHLKARHYATFEDGSEEIFNGVYNLEFILVGEDLIGTYGFYYDFVTGKLAGDHSSEQYYNDISSLSTRHDYREIEDEGKTKVIDNAPTFCMSLNSGESREITFASRSYFKGVRMQMSENAADADVDKRRYKPEILAEKAIKALRQLLRAHKGTAESNPSL